MKKITLLVNGKEAVCEHGALLSEFVSRLREGHGLSPETPLVAEVNGEIIPKNRWGDVSLKAGDVLEIVHFVGGG